MQLFKKIPWKYDATEYEIRIYYDPKTINIVMFKGNYPANGFRYQIQFSKQTEVDSILKSSGYEYLIDYCRNDIINRKWNLLLQNAG